MTAPPKLRCWPGCMALVIRGRNSGKQVQCLQYLGPAAPGSVLRIVHNATRYQVHVAHHDGYYWWCETNFELVDANGKTSKVGAIPDHWLLPLTPPPKPDAEVRVQGKEHEEPA